MKTEQKLLSQLVGQINSDKCCHLKATNIRECLHTHTHTIYIRTHMQTYTEHTCTHNIQIDTHIHIYSHTRAHKHIHLSVIMNLKRDSDETCVSPTHRFIPEDGDP